MNEYYTGDEALAHLGLPSRSVPNGQNVSPETTVQYRSTQSNYDMWHPEDALPTTHSGIMLGCDDAYKTVGIVRNVIDLMSDFLTQNIGLRHPNPTHERLFQNWFARIGGPQVSESIARNLFKYGTAIIRREDYRLTMRGRRDLQTSQASLDPQKVYRRVVPGKYHFYNPCLIDVIGGGVHHIAGTEPQYGMKLPQSLINIILAPRSTAEREFVESIPRKIRDEITSNPDAIIPLPDDIIVLHYKRDDWQNWSTPMLNGILYNIKMLKKLQLADMSALNTSMDIIRLWKLGDLEHKIIPQDAAYKKLYESLEVPNNGVRDLVWNPAIECEIKQVDVSKILAPEKYESTLNAIYIGLGIPPSLAGNASRSSGTTNNLISLKTLIKRLEYGRQKLREFWIPELERFRKAMGIPKSAQLYFDNANLGEEEAEKKLWIELADRDIVSHESVQERFGANPIIEKNRLNREYRDRDASRTVPKSGPYHDGDIKKRVTKTLVEQGKISPQEIGITAPIISEEPTTKPQPPSSENTNRLPAGRPQGTPDTLPRKRRQFNPQTRAVWFGEASSRAQEVAQAAILEVTGKPNLRKLSREETQDLEVLRRRIVFNMEPMSEISEVALLEAATKGDSAAARGVPAAIQQTQAELGRDLSPRERLEVEKQIWINL